MPQGDETVNKLPTVGHNSRRMSVDEQARINQRIALNMFNEQTIKCLWADDRVQKRHYKALAAMLDLTEPNTFKCVASYSAIASVSGQPISTVVQAFKELRMWGYMISGSKGREHTPCALNREGRYSPLIDRD